jgi:hypothetical protein
MFIDKHYTYKGFEYRTWDEIESDGDNKKTYHECWKDGKEVKMSREFYNTSPYDLVKQEDFQRFVEEVEFVEFVKG